jgi:hypothetical protein
MIQLCAISTDPHLALVAPAQPYGRRAVVELRSGLRVKGKQGALDVYVLFAFS